MDNQEILSLEQDMSLDEMDKVLNLESILIEEMLVYGCSMPMSDNVVIDSCKVHPFRLHSEVSCPKFLLAWEISMEGKYNFEHASLRLEGENALIDDNNESCNLKGMLMFEFASS